MLQGPTLSETVVLHCGAEYEAVCVGVGVAVCDADVDVDVGVEVCDEVAVAADTAAVCEVE